MKIISKEEEEAHYSAVVRGGITGGTLGLAAGLGGAMIAARRYPAFRNLTLQFRTFLVSSAGTVGAIIMAERASIDFGRARDPMSHYKDESSRIIEEVRRTQQAQASQAQRLKEWGRENRYTIVLSSWLAAMIVSFALVSRAPMSAAQKLVQARVYAQGLTLAVLVATAALEMGDAKSGKGRWETVMVLDPNDPEHKHMIEKRVHKEEYAGQDLWMDMVAAEEKRLKVLKEQKDAAAATKTAPSTQ